ncbi:hypothetical protein [Streptomyces sp. SLBN-8D4]|jgi:hypothetical protein|uniref:hypothetical protein n=1 Tax=Streptomyces sp. SLBN-8D4 TaxID=3377728 RepID=UPI003C7A28AA
MTDGDLPGDVAAQDWFVRARVRISEEHRANSLEGKSRVFRPGEELEMMQWGRAAQEIDTDAWWTTHHYIPAAHIVPAGKIQVLEILEERRPEADV